MSEDYGILFTISINPKKPHRRTMNPVQSITLDKHKRTIDLSEREKFLLELHQICCYIEDEHGEISTLHINDAFFMFQYIDLIYKDGFIWIGIEEHFNLGIYIRKSAGLGGNDTSIYLIPAHDYYAPLFDKGALYMTLQQYNQLRDFVPKFPPCDTIPVLTKMDCARMFWMEAPDAIKSSTPYEFNKNAYLTAYAPEGEEIVTILETMLKDYNYLQDPVTLELVPRSGKTAVVLDTPVYFKWKDVCKVDEEILRILEVILKDHASSQDPVTLEPASRNSEITIILDTPDYFEWKVLCWVDNQYYLRLEPGYQVRCIR